MAIHVASVRSEKTRSSRSLEDIDPRVVPPREKIV
jgi:hypothetical protein